MRFSKLETAPRVKTRSNTLDSVAATGGGGYAFDVLDDSLEASYGKDAEISPAVVKFKETMKLKVDTGVPYNRLPGHVTKADDPMLRTYTP